MRKDDGSSERIATGRIIELDGLRAASVLLVILSHQMTMAGNIPCPSYLRREAYQFGSAGVQIFFAISGFIITRLQIEEIRATGHFSLVQFYIRRFFRIIPAYWAYLAVVTVLWLVGEIKVRAICVLSALVFVTNFTPFSNSDSWFVGHSWSLSVEEQYYLFGAFFMAGLGRIGFRWTVGILLGLYFIFIILYRLGPLLHVLFPPLLPVFKFIIAGVLMALGWGRIGPLLDRLPGWVPCLLATFILLRANFEGHLLNVLLGNPLDAGVSALLVGWVVRHPESCGFLRWSFLQWIGATSYSFYLWQQLFSGSRELYGPIVLSSPILFLLLLPLCVAGSFYGIERPCIWLGKKICRRLEPPILSPHESAYVGG